MSSIQDFDFSRLYLRKTQTGRETLLARPGITLTFYIEEPLAVTCSCVADLIDFFFTIVPRMTLRSYLANNGHYKPLTAQQLAKDLKRMRNLPEGHEAYDLSYSESDLAEAGAYQVLFKAMNPTVNRPDFCNIVRLEFPENIIDTLGEERFLKVILDAADILPFFSGHAGFAFKPATSWEPQAFAAITPLLPNYLGFDTSDHWMCTRMKGHTVTSHWINLLGPQLTEKLGGLETMKATIGEAEIKPLRNGTWIRGARFPPIGDLNQGAIDIGQLPNVARLLRSVRCLNPRTGYKNFDINAWLARFDELPAKDWNNRSV